MKLPPFKSPIVRGRVRPTVAATLEITGTTARKVTRADLEEHCPDWRTKRVEGINGAVSWVKVALMATVPNIKAIAYLYGWRIRFNEMTKRVELTRAGTVIPQDDQDNTALTLFGDDVVRCELPRDGLAALVDAAATTDRYHPALDWIHSVPWDGVSRLEMFHRTLELADPKKTKLAAKLLDRWMLQGIGALIEPNGIAAQGILVLSGPQHIGKTYWVTHLVGIDGVVGTGLNLDPDNKDSVLRVIRHWIAELGELGSTTRRSDVESLKAFVTNSEDVIRLPYAKRDSVYRRRTILIGTVNGAGFLVDDTGNRRFWVIDVIRCHVLEPEVMQQVWAEYLTLYRDGARWHLDADTLAELNQSNLRFTAVDPLREKIATGWDWSGTDWSQVDPANWRACPDILWKSASDICKLVGIERPTRGEATRAGAIVRDLQRMGKQCNHEPLERATNGARLLAIPARLGHWH